MMGRHLFERRGGQPAARPAGAQMLAAGLIAAATLLFATLAPVRAYAQSLPATGTIAVPTYKSVGLYWSNPGGTSGCEVKYRKAGSAAWSQGLPLWYDARDSQCRGSLVNLTPGTQYEVELNLPGQAPSRALTFSTWANTVPVARTVTVSGGTATLNVTEGGSASGYVVYDGKGATIDGQNSAQYNVTINASYVVLRGLVLRGAKQDAIRISPNVKNVIIEDNDISDWGRQRSGRFGVDMDSAIRAVCTQPTLERVTIQRNRISNPRYSANSWSDGHPAGPQAVTFSHCGGNHVIRHNDIFSTNGNYFNDILGGEDNFTKNGFPNSDTDIYGNRLSNAWDDGIEAEGANENVRIWGNYIDRTAIGIATTVTSVGPAYVFRNVWNRAQMYEKIASPDQDDRQPFFKSGTDASLGYGRRYFFHNTMLQAPQSGLAYTLGGGFGMGGTGSAQLIHNTWSKNNIYHLWKPKGAFYQTAGSGNVIANDMYNGTAGDAPMTGGINATPRYALGHGWVSEAGGQYQLEPGSPGYDAAERIPNFNDGYVGAAPDVGAHEGGAAAMGFGIAASPGSAVSGTSITPTTTTPTTPATPTTPTTPTPTTSGVSLSAAALGNFATTRMQTVQYTNNTSASVTFIQASMSSGRYGQANTCGQVAPGASCTATITYYPSNSGPDTATFTMTSTAPNSPHVVSLSATAAASGPSLVNHFYRTILRREPDAAGQAYWDGELTRVSGLGVNASEVWYAMAAAFFASPEYAAFGRSDSGFITDLYAAFFNRAPDAAGLAHWSGLIAQGMPRSVVLTTFMFSTEFAALAGGGKSARPEADIVLDFYRGLLARLPESSGFVFWLQRFRAAQCRGNAAVNAEVEAISSAFANGSEFGARGRTNTLFVADLYNAFLRRGGDLAGVRFWIQQLDTGAQSREDLRRAFIASPEFAARVSALVSAGCAA